MACIGTSEGVGPRPGALWLKPIYAVSPFVCPKGVFEESDLGSPTIPWSLP